MEFSVDQSVLFVLPVRVRQSRSLRNVKAFLSPTTAFCFTWGQHAISHLMPSSLVYKTRVTWTRFAVWYLAVPVHVGVHRLMRPAGIISSLLQVLVFIILVPFMLLFIYLHRLPTE